MTAPTYESLCYPLGAVQVGRIGYFGRCNCGWQSTDLAPTVTAALHFVAAQHGYTKATDGCAACGVLHDAIPAYVAFRPAVELDEETGNQREVWVCQEPTGCAWRRRKRAEQLGNFDQELADLLGAGGHA